MPLQAKLDAFKGDFEAGKPPHGAPTWAIAAMHRATEELIASGLASRALKAGALSAPFILHDSEGERSSWEELLAKGPLVLNFYQGSWCPYCGMELQALQQALPALRAAGASLVAISPQTPVSSRETKLMNGLEFPILSDGCNEVAALFGLRFALPDYLIEAYQSLGYDLPRFNGDESWTLPIPARFVIAQTGFIRYAEVSPDSTRRSEPLDILPVLRSLASRST